VSVLTFLDSIGNWPMTSKTWPEFDAAGFTADINSY
jgi:hypothetical protein